MTPLAPGGLDLLVVTDLHYVGRARHACAVPARRSALGPVLVAKALRRLRQEGIAPGAVVLLGDLVDEGNAEGAEADLAAIAAEARGPGLPVLAVPGNHDRDPARFARLFGCAPGLHRVGGWGLLVFHDEVGEGDATRRPDDGLGLPERVAAEHPGLPLVALQHNPLHPPIPGGYPYLPANAAGILAGYARAGVRLSLSGHYHAGQPAHDAGSGVVCATVPAACEAPYRFAHVRLAPGEAPVVREHALALDVPGLCDVHGHTEYAYCGEGIAAARNLEIARALGVATVGLTEHAFQLYFPPAEAWSFRWQTDPEMVAAAWAGGRGRMPEYRAFAGGLRAPDVRLGLEVDLCTGGLLLAPEDRPGWDLLVGAVHEIPGFVRGETGPAGAARLFLAETERILAQGVDVLAHPFRFFRRKGMEPPRALYPEVAALLARHGAAAEVNFHTNEPDPLFFRECARRGVRVALGTDTHHAAEAGDLHPHLRLLDAAGIGREQFDTVLYRPPCDAAAAAAYSAP